jgi:hypothetical protein
MKDRHNDYVININHLDSVTDGRSHTSWMSFALAVRVRPSFLPSCRTFQNRALLRPVPPPTGTCMLCLGHGLVALTFFAGDISNPQDFLKAIGRGSETKISFDTWDDLWKTNGQALKKAGLATRDRRYVAFAETMGLMSDSLNRYILWAMEHYRQGDRPSEYTHEPKPKKKIRGCGYFPSAQLGRSGRTLNSHGPAVQFGKRIRSRRRK